MKKDILKKILRVLEGSKKIVLIPHKNPDGDALGSSLSLYFFLNRLRHKTFIISPNDYPSFLEWMPGQNNILKFTRDLYKSKQIIESADVIFTLDFNDLSRVDELKNFILKSKAVKIMIDHHENPSDYAQIILSDSSIGSTCEIVYDLISNLNEKLIDQKIATCLYTGIMTDSGSFRFPSTSAKTHMIISKLIEKGVNHSEIHGKIYDSFSFERIQLLGAALANMKKINKLPVVYIKLSQKELNEFNFKKGDSEGFVNYGLSIKGIKLSVIMIENEKDNIIKMSFRSKGNFDVNKFAKVFFQGGGHINAAGGISNLSIEETEFYFINSIRKFKSQLNV